MKLRIPSHNYLLACTLFGVLLSGSAMGQGRDSVGSRAGTSDSSTAKELESVVVTGLPAPIKLQNALSNYRIITKSTMTAMGAADLADALTNQLNINIGNDAILGSNVSMQGLGGNKVKILIDGMPINGREGGNIDLGQLNLARIERVELVQGPMSIVYGSDALGGVINLITSKSSKPYEVAATLNYESVGRYNADLSASRSWKKHLITIGGGRHYFGGWKDLDTGSVDPHRRLLWKPKEQYFASALWNAAFSDALHLQVASDFVKEKVTNKGLATVNSQAGYAFDEYYHTTRSINRAILSGKAGKGRWELSNSYSLYYRIKERVRKDLVSLDETLTKGTGDQDTSRFDDITLRSNYSNRKGKLAYDGGYDINLQWGKSSSKIAGGTKQQEDYALYANATYELGKKVSVKGGLRADYNKQYGSPIVYSLQMLYKPSEAIQARASYAKGFRAPSLKEQYLEFIDQNHHILGNADLKPEEGDHMQGSVSWLVYNAKKSSIRLMATAFYNGVRNEIVLANQHPEDSLSIDYTYANVSRVRNAIGNIQAEVVHKALSLTAGYGLTHTLAQDGEYAAFDVSEVTANAQYYWSLPKLRFALFYKWTGAQPFLSSTIEGSASYNGTLPDYQMMDVSVGRKFLKGRVDVVAGVKNVFDVQQLAAAGATTGGAHTGDGNANFLPRRLFITLKLGLY